MYNIPILLAMYVSVQLECAFGKTPQFYKTFPNNTPKMLRDLKEVNRHAKRKQDGICHGLSTAVHKKKLAVTKLNAIAERLAVDKAKHVENSDSADTEISIIRIFLDQLDFHEKTIYQTIDWLTQSLVGQYKDYSHMKESIESRLKYLRDATFQEEQVYHQLQLAEKDINKTVEMNNSQKEGGIIEEILSQVANAADELEEGLGDNIQEDDAIEQRKLGKQGENIEAVVRLESADDIPRLEDADGRQFILSRGQDSTRPLEDLTLLLDLVYIMVLCTMMGHASSVIGLPIMFGQVLCGVILGPASFNLLSSIVQIETLAELGVFFIMFTVGLEFSPKRIKQVLFISLVGSAGVMALMVLCAVLLSLTISKSSFSESAFIAACFSLSSTPLVLKLTSGATNSSSREGSPNHRSANKLAYTDVLLGILVFQDILMGMLVAFLPALAGHGSVLKSAGLFAQVLLAFLVIGALSAALVKLVQKTSLVIASLSTEMLTLTSTGLVFAMMWVTFELGISMELGCFLAGSIISAGGESLAEKVETLATPIKDFLSSIFFTAVGLHVFPSFVLVELGLLALATVLVVSFKFGISFLLMKLSLPKLSRKYSSIIAAGLSQVSEFSFVLSSRARHLQLISREVYLLILSVSTLSLMMAPFLWKLVLVTERPKLRRSTSVSTNPDI
ncbi:TMCO3 [Bugula neritina]|uniref:TMCO3 n=1 Tax=Bugula neritina TaxID=10212 RepID=A0A7J7KDQ0_BUGNE|nr:TMCO3 [Bugula neritina]